MNAQQIPGPWTAHAPSEDLGTRRWTIRAPGRSPVVSFEVASVSGRSVTDPHTASLIAAAPELLAALNEINMAACYASEEATETREAVLLQIGELARAAIAKATGGVA